MSICALNLASVWSHPTARSEKDTLDISINITEALTCPLQGITTKKRRTLARADATATAACAGAGVAAVEE